MTWTDPESVSDAVSAAIAAQKDWDGRGAAERADILDRIGDLYETHCDELMAICTREGGKSLLDGIAEVREAVDFCRYYAMQARNELAEPVELPGPTGESNTLRMHGKGVFVCISPWNFPLAIFTGQIVAALAAGNAVLAKPAEQTPLIAARAVSLMQEAGVPEDVIQCLPGDGKVGAALTGDPRIAGVAFTGSTETARIINRSLAEREGPLATLIAETGGQNAMVVDSSALPEQVVKDVIHSAFLSAGQRCSALRVLYVQADVADRMLEMLAGAMEEIAVGDPGLLETDIGPVIDEAQLKMLEEHAERMDREAKLIARTPLREDLPKGHWFAPRAYEIDGIDRLEREIFGPILHVVRYKSSELDTVIDKINGTGYGLTLGVHSRIDRVYRHIAHRACVGNAYVNRNMTGAVVGVQPFGGEGLSGTGPKAGGPRYLQRFLRPLAAPSHSGSGIREPSLDVGTVQAAIDALQWHEPQALEQQDMPGPTGEANRLTLWPRGLVLCLGPTAQDAAIQAGTARRMGCPALMVAPGVDAMEGVDGFLSRESLSKLRGIAVVALWSDDDDLGEARRALAARDGALVPLVSNDDLDSYCVHERHTCIDTTAAGGNASLLAADGE